MKNCPACRSPVEEIGTVGNRRYFACSAWPCRWEESKLVCNVCDETYDECECGKYNDWPRRFYFADGHCESRMVTREADGSLLRVYKLLTPEGPMPSLMSLDLDVKIPDHRIRYFELRGYGYPEGFIGPHRNEDYHELTPQRSPS